MFPQLLLNGSAVFDPGAWQVETSPRYPKPLKAVRTSKHDLKP